MVRSVIGPGGAGDGRALWSPKRNVSTGFAGPSKGTWAKGKPTGSRSRSHAGDVLFEGAFGYADKAAGRALRVDDPIFTMSVSKQFSLIPIIRQVELGNLSFMTRVAEVIPEFAQRGKDKVTLAQLLTHTSGLTSGLPVAEDNAYLQKYVDFVCTTQLEGVPGEQVKYSARAGHAVMAEMARRVDGSGLSFSEMVGRDLFTPLRMENSSLGGRDDLVERMCPVVTTYTDSLMLPGAGASYAEGTRIALGPGAEVPAGGALTTLPDMQRYVEAFRRGGELDGQRVMSKAMVDFTAQNRTGTMHNMLLDLVLGEYGWDRWPACLGYGWIMGGAGVAPGPMGHLNSPRAFGGMGAGSNGFWIDPVHDVTFVFLSTGLMEESRNQQRMRRYADLALSAVTR